MANSKINSVTRTGVIVLLETLTVQDLHRFEAIEKTKMPLFLVERGLSKEASTQLESWCARHPTVSRVRVQSWGIGRATRDALLSASYMGWDWAWVCRRWSIPDAEELKLWSQKQGKGCALVQGISSIGEGRHDVWGYPLAVVVPLLKQIDAGRGEAFFSVLKDALTKKLPLYSFERPRKHRPSIPWRVRWQNRIATLFFWQ